MRQQLPLEIRQAMEAYEPVRVDGLLLHPVRVKEYGLFQQARPALEFLQQSLPVRLLGMPILQAYYQMDLERIEAGMPPTGLLTSAVLGLVLALRLGEGKDLKTRMGMVTVRHEPKDPTRLRELYMAEDGKLAARITPLRYRKLRSVLAAQNGVKLWSEEANPDLVEAERVLREKESIAVLPDIRREVMAVSVMTRTPKGEIANWPVLRLEETAGALRQVMDYMICAVNQGAGCTWKGGNPVPHPWFERQTDGDGGLIALGSLDGGKAAKAVRNTQNVF